METELITYRTFNNVELANELSDVLNAHQIIYQLESTPPAFDPRYMGSAATEYVVKISPNDFERVNEILQNEAIENVNSVEPDYYLFDFTDEELIDLISKPDQWNPFDVTLARKILAERGKPITDEEITTIHQRRLAELKKTEPSQSSWIIAGYIFALAGGILGLFIGWHLSSHKKTLPNGEQMFAYSANDRRQGKIIFYLALVMVIIWITIKTLKNSQ